MLGLAGDGSWYEVTKIIPRNVISSGGYFGYAVSLCSDRDLIGSYVIDKTVIKVGRCHRVNGLRERN